MKIGTLALRVTIGGFFVGHGTQKLFGVQGGAGLKGTAKFFEEGLGIKPGLAQATVAGVAETGGGLGLILGYHTPLAASTVVASMTTAVQKVHGKNGWNIQNGGYEYNALLIAGAFAIAESGPGFLSLDALRGQQRKGIFWGVFALGAGVAGAFASHAASGYFGGGSSLGEAVGDAVADVAGSVADAADSVADTAKSVAEAAPEALESTSTPVSVEEALADPAADPIVVEPLVVDETSGKPSSPDAPLEPGI